MRFTVLTGLCLLVASCYGWEETSSAEYIAKTAAEKSAIIWANIIEDTTPADWFGLLDLPAIFTESMCPTFRAPGDELPWEEGIFNDDWRWKLIHTVGTVGQVEWKNVGGHGFTGIFTGKHNCQQIMANESP